MPKNIQKNNNLLIVSDTGMYRNNIGVKAFGPVVTEVEYFLKEFDSITWVGFERLDQIKNQSYSEIENNKLKYVMFPRVGGKTALSKLKIIFQYPLMFFIITKLLFKHKYIHIRAPSHPAVITMFLSLFFKKKVFWFKYAGSWVDKASKYYGLQRDFLKRLNKNSKITVNGNWKTNNPNIIAFENPCLDKKDRERGKDIIQHKEIDKKINFCFVGALNRSKGVDKILEAFTLIKDSSKISKIHFVGDGEDREKFVELSKKLNVKTIFHGFLAKDKIVEIYKDVHFIILPSKSEGFPKVIGEGMNYGCVPIVSNISCMDQYIIQNKNGFLIEPNTAKQLNRIINEVCNLSGKRYKEIIKMNYTLSDKFSYLYYMDKIREFILK